MYLIIIWHRYLIIYINSRPSLSINLTTIFTYLCNLDLTIIQVTHSINESIKLLCFLVHDILFWSNNLCHKLQINVLTVSENFASWSGSKLGFSAPNLAYSNAVVLSLYISSSLPCLFKEAPICWSETANWVTMYFHISLHIIALILMRTDDHMNMSHTMDITWLIPTISDQNCVQLILIQLLDCMSGGWVWANEWKSSQWGSVSCAPLKKAVGGGGGGGGSIHSVAHRRMMI